MDVINLDGWSEDNRFSPYPEGSRDKYALIAPAEPQETCIVPEHRYLMKFSNPRYPVQFWSEIIARIIGDHVGVPVPPCFYAEDIRTGIPGSLIEWFYGDAVERHLPVPAVAANLDAAVDLELPANVPSTHSLYVPGSSYMARQIEGYDLRTGKQHNLKHVGFLIARFRQKWGLDCWPHWAQILTFDALIGNTDRHQDNWGVLWRASDDGAMAPRFAPAFDNGTSLLHEIIEGNLNRFDDVDNIDRYIFRGRHHIKWELLDEKPIKHLDIFDRLIERRPHLRDVIYEIIEKDFNPAFEQIRRLTEFHGPVPLSEQRANVICRVVERRIEKIKGLVARND